LNKNIKQIFPEKSKPEQIHTKVWKIRNDNVQRLQYFNYKQLELISLSLKAAANPLSMAPSTLGLTQKSPHMASLLFLSQRHFSSWAILAAGNALPLQNQPT